MMDLMTRQERCFDVSANGVSHIGDFDAMSGDLFEVTVCVTQSIT